MTKIVIVFFVGLVEQALYTMYLLSVTRKQKYVSSILMTLYMTLYLGIMAYAIKDTDTIALLIAYALACGIGNLLVMLYDAHKHN